MKLIALCLVRLYAISFFLLTAKLQFSLSLHFTIPSTSSREIEFCTVAIYLATFSLWRYLVSLWVEEFSFSVSPSLCYNSQKIKGLML
ncbi:hypothetical protein VNO78_15382 [Psophocarpus tetragonolobus]|uniref:Uncharacterized protein n=1 Tax=Psophocarpus tetragonolobus TaxID=3891 RepID=A0AAN9XJU6_PSOTE